MKQTQTIPETFLGVGYVSDRACLPLEAVRVPVRQPAFRNRTARPDANHKFGQRFP